MSMAPESAPTRRRRSPKGEQRRAEILAAAADEFARGGYDSASLADVARRAGITQAGLLHHFPSKTALLHAVLDHRDDLDSDGPPTEPAHGVDFLIAFITTLRRHEDNPSETAFFAMLSTESTNATHPAHDYFSDRYRTIARNVTSELERVINATLLPRHISVLDITRSFVGIADGMRIQWLFEPGSVDRSELVARYLELLEPYMFDSAREEFRAALARWRRGH